MYSPNRMYKDVLDTDIYMSVAPKADDLWLSAMARLNHQKIISTGYPNKYIAISIPNNKTLYSENSEGNDIQIKEINKYYLNKINRKVF